MESRLLLDTDSWLASAGCHIRRHYDRPRASPPRYSACAFCDSIRHLGDAQDPSPPRALWVGRLFAKASRAPVLVQPIRPVVASSWVGRLWPGQATILPRDQHARSEELASVIKVADESPAPLRAGRRLDHPRRRSGSVLTVIRRREGNAGTAGGKPGPFPLANV
jgi:hypothetical protein